MGAVSHTRELRQLLAKTISQVQSGEVTAADARAIAELSKGIIQAARLDLELYKLSRDDGPLPLESIIGGEEPATITYQSAPLDLLREKVCEALAEAGAMKCETISVKLQIPPKRLQKVLDHEWFEETTEGYRIAQA